MGVPDFTSRESLPVYFVTFSFDLLYFHSFPFFCWLPFFPSGVTDALTFLFFFPLSNLLFHKVLLGEFFFSHPAVGEVLPPTLPSVFFSLSL